MSKCYIVKNKVIDGFNLTVKFGHDVRNIFLTVLKDICSFGLS